MIFFSYKVFTIPSTRALQSFSFISQVEMLLTIKLLIRSSSSCLLKPLLQILTVLLQYLHYHYYSLFELFNFQRFKTSCIRFSLNFLTSLSISSAFIFNNRLSFSSCIACSRISYSRDFLFSLDLREASLLRSLSSL